MSPLHLTHSVSEAASSHQSSAPGAVCTDGTLLRDTSGAVKPRPSDHNTSTLIRLCHLSVLLQWIAVCYECVVTV